MEDELSGFEEAKSTGFLDYATAKNDFLGSPRPDLMTVDRAGGDE